MTAPPTVTYVLIPGAGGSADYWQPLVDELRRRGREAVAVALPAADPHAALPEYAAVVRAAVDAHPRVVLVAQSLGAFTAPLVADHPAVRLLVLVNPMVPAPGETAGDWWAATGHGPARAAYAAAQGRDPHAGVDLAVDFFHDVPAEVTARLLAGGGGEEAEAVFVRPNPLRRWPDLPTRVVTGRDDRFFPADFQRRLAVERLGARPDELPGGHLLALSQPRRLADLLESYARDI
ncbi:Alpha/beta hydrolase family protein [Micromonospora purpureochromogenes]|uniref:Alpha/beta hydrolase family protein n=1 Tax=Micromonospora purpureochromogenes TaxID=47872 RepID=A0A1C4YT86_9ACTN|nr:alpha/beta hydrolase [Micromonospora purpureochromogenes]SCF23864.1 Alpha/beta hydrolase family protein [Micromonospora purpureochromogenes]